MTIYKFVLASDILLDYILKQGRYNHIKEIINYLVQNKNGYISVSSVAMVCSAIAKHYEKFLPYLHEILSNLTVWKVPSHVDLKHPLARKNTDFYLIHLTI